MARKKGTGRLFARGGTWYMRWRMNGQERTESTHIGIDEENARARAEEELLKATEVVRMRDKASRLTIVKAMLQTAEERMKELMSTITRQEEKRVYKVGELAIVFENTSRRIDCSEEMLAIYKSYVEALSVFVGKDCPVESVNAELADAFAAHLAKGRSPNTYNKYLNGLTLVWKTVAPIVGIEENPWKDLPRKRLDTHVRRALTDEELKTVLDAAKGEMRKVVAVGAYTGLRMGDACRLRWNNFKDGVLRTVTAKTGSEVAIPVHARLAEILGSKPKDAKPDDFVTQQLADIYETCGCASVSHRVARLFKKCGIETTAKVKGRRSVAECGFHSLRHTFVSRCVEAGIPQHVVKAIVGHASTKMTEHYTHLHDETILKAFATMK